MQKIKNQIRALEKKMMSDKVKLQKLRTKFKPELVENYTFESYYASKVNLSDLFGEKNELIMIHNMGICCSSCTTWADGFNGVLKHLEDRAAFCVESPDPVAIQKSFAADRGWAFNMVSSKKSSFRKDMGYQDNKGAPWPGVSAFNKSKDGKIYRLSDTLFGPGDNFCVVWDLCDLLPEGWKNWNCGYYYSKVKR